MIGTERLLSESRAIYEIRREHRKPVLQTHRDHSIQADAEDLDCLDLPASDAPAPPGCRRHRRPLGDYYWTITE